MGLDSHRARDRRPALRCRATRSRSRRWRRWRRSRAGRRRSSTPGGSRLHKHHRRSFEHLRCGARCVLTGQRSGDKLSPGASGYSARTQGGTTDAAGKQNAPPEKPTWYRWLPRPPQRASTMPRCSSPRRMWYVARSLSVQIVGFCRRKRSIGRIRARRMAQGDQIADAEHKGPHLCICSCCGGGLGCWNQ